MSLAKSKLSKGTTATNALNRTFNGVKTLTLRPRMSEKTYALSQEKNVYVFAVIGGVNKLTIKRAVESQFKVAVENVNVLNQKGKTKRTIRKRSRPMTGRQSDVKKAYVTLKKGDKIPVFTAVEEAEKKAKKSGMKSKDKTITVPKTTQEKKSDKAEGGSDRDRGMRKVFRRLTK